MYTLAKKAWNRRPTVYIIFFSARSHTIVTLYDSNTEKGTGLGPTEIFDVPGWDFQDTWVGFLMYLGRIMEVPGQDYGGTWVDLWRYLGGIMEVPGWDYGGTWVGFLKYLGGIIELTGWDF